MQLGAVPPAIAPRVAATSDTALRLHAQRQRPVARTVRTAEAQRTALREFAPVESVAPQPVPVLRQPAQTGRSAVLHQTAPPESAQPEFALRRAALAIAHGLINVERTPIANPGYVRMEHAM